MAGQVRSADVGTQQFNVQNELARQRFLDQNSLARQQANIAAANQANMYNLQRQQQVADINAQQQNQEMNRQRQAQLQKANLELERRKAVAGIYGDQAGLAYKQAGAEAGGIGTMLSGLSQLAGAGKDAGWWGQSSTPEQDLQKDISAGKYDYLDEPYSPLSNWNKPKGKKLSSSLNTGYLTAAHGGRIPGEAKTDGDSYENDTVPTMLSPDEIVVPRSKAKDPKKAKTFIDEIFEQEKLDKKQKKGYDKNESLLDLIAKLHSEKSK
jgi:hypothetical protein